jgi:hypothetical protein
MTGGDGKRGLTALALTTLIVSVHEPALVNDQSADAGGLVAYSSGITS